MPSYLGQEVDVCVIGSGAGGGPIAFELARAGASVVVLEKGPWYKKEDFDHDELASSRRNRWVPFVSDEPHLMVTPHHREPRKTSDGWIAHCVGGGTTHMSGFFYRLHHEDFAMASRYGELEGAELADWPIDYAGLAPYYDRVEREIGVSGLAGGNPFGPPRSGPYLQPPLSENPLARLVDEGAQKLGLHAFKTPRAVASEPIHGRAACSYCSFCGSYGCEVDAKSSTLAALIPRALKTRHCELRPHSMAFEIGVGPTGKADVVRYYDKDGQAREQRARLIVVSATAIESARLLLNSRSDVFPTGLANRRGLVGKHLSFSTLAKGYGVFAVEKLPPELRPHHQVHFVHRSVQDHYLIDSLKGRYDKGGTLNFLLPHRNPIFAMERLSKRNDPPLWGAKLKEAMMDYYTIHRELEVEVFGEFLPNPGTFVSVEGQVKDRFGIPSATIHLDNHPLDRANSRLLVERALEVFKAAGAIETGVETAGGTTFVLQHGTCRFGSDPKTSVLDPWCRAHDVDNLYVVDGSFMPSSGGVPSTFTIMANAFRVAEHLVKRFRDGILAGVPQ